MTIYNHFIRVFILLIISSIIVGCDNSSENIDSVLNTQIEQSNTEKKRYLVGADSNYPPLEFRDSNGQLIGLEIDMISAIAKDQNFDVSILPMNWSDIMPSLDSGERDIGISLWYSEERAKKYDMSVPLYSTKLVLARLKSKTATDNVDSIRKAKISLQGPDSLNHTSYKKSGLDAEGKNNTLIMTTSTYLAFKSLLNGESDYILDSDIQLRYFIKNSALTINDFVFIEDDRFNSATWVYAVKKGNSDLIEKINKGISNLKNNGSYQKIVSKWFK